MREFVIGLLVVFLIGVLSLLGFLLVPLLLVLGIFLRLAVVLLLGLFVIWFIGKATLLIIESLRKK